MKKERARGLLGIRIGSYNLEGLLEASMQAIVERRSQFTFACANPHSLVVAQSDEKFRSALQSCSAVVADGVGVSVTSRLLGSDVGPRITGTDFFLGVMSRINRRGGKVFFLGSTPFVLDRIVSRTSTEFPNVQIGVRSPPFGEWTDQVNQDLIAAIRAAQPDVLWIGMTAPKQEKWVHDYASLCGVPVIGSIGAVFDYYADTIHRAPKWVCRLGLEWLYRLVGEPRRLWRRTLISAPVFLWFALRERFALRMHR